MTGEQLIRHYNMLVSLMVAGRFRPNYGRRGGFLHFTAARLVDAENLVVWLEEGSFHPPMYFAGAFGAHNWCYQPKWDRLREQRYVDAYRDGTAEKWWEIVDRQAEMRKPPPPTKRHEEMVKQRFRNERAIEVCRLAKDLTGGFNPSSQYCRDCKLRGECEQDG